MLVIQSCFVSSVSGFVLALSGWHACMQAKHGGTGGRFGDYLCVDCAHLPCVSGRNQFTKKVFTRPGSKIPMSNTGMSLYQDGDSKKKEMFVWRPISRSSVIRPSPVSVPLIISSSRNCSQTAIRGSGFAGSLRSDSLWGCRDVRCSSGLELPWKSSFTDMSKKDEGIGCARVSPHAT